MIELMAVDLAVLTSNKKIKQSLMYLNIGEWSKFCRKVSYRYKIFQL